MNPQIGRLLSDEVAAAVVQYHLDVYLQQEQIGVPFAKPKHPDKLGYCDRNVYARPAQDRMLFQVDNHFSDNS
jgi:hypothetical protein